ncbi:ArsR/SmtB family transcription factor [Tenacibaculum agarivorans]|uniref:ArsR/SmtB family transcription factor n=1 Tax=Tenacibaculum agarivorans TaxID=1908389 RepID=UPI00094B9495|nr:metalloregulator ArsR/SmtB family transcription factor [Tenacibaculum agarivorans]
MSKQINTDLLFKAIADPTRRKIFHVLVVAASAMSITQIAKDFDMTRQGVTKHIKTLESAGLVEIKTEGRERFCFPNTKPLKEIKNWLNFYEQFWDNALDQLGSYLDQKK